MKTIFVSTLTDDNLDNLFREVAQELRPEFDQADWDKMNKRLDQMEENDSIPRAVMADKFIDLANEFTKAESKERVGAAIMFAAARYNATWSYPEKPCNFKSDPD